MSKEKETARPPSILAPAGNRESFLAAVAAGADAIYCGLKHFSARMGAKNFLLEELAALVRFAHDKEIEVYVTLNSLLKPDEMGDVGTLLESLQHRVKPDAIIIQDLALVQVAKQTGFSGQIHLSTLANVSFSAAFELVRNKVAADRVVIPRELNIDEIKMMAMSCPEGLDLEIFIHGALCYGVSGRCYWSSYFGGMSGLRGRCVQPCRRVYAQDEKKNRFFSSMDLSLDVLVKVLLSIPKVRAWKIEGRKKGPHYVYHTVKAYRMLRDHAGDPKIKKEALHLLSYALGRPGTHYNFLPQRPQNPVNLNHQTGSGLFLGRIKGTPKKPFIVPRKELLSGDVLRVGYEDEPWHSLNNVNKYVPSKGRFYLKPLPPKSPAKGIPVFLRDRREKDLILDLADLEKQLNEITAPNIPTREFNVRLPKKTKIKADASDLHVYHRLEKSKPKGHTGLWLSNHDQKKIPRHLWSRLWWWLPPVIWPEGEEKVKISIDLALKKGSRNFVLNAPWQMAFFSFPKRLNIWAGPFCNITNALAIKTLVSFHFKGVIVSPELSRKDYFLLPKHSPVPLGIVISGSWPLCISRIISENLNTEKAFISPKKEAAWVIKNGPNYWIYPNWIIDIRAKKDQLKRMGYRLFVNLAEPIPAEMKLKKRPGLWNWDVGLH
jgi:putative protease